MRWLRMGAASAKQNGKKLIHFQFQQAAKYVCVLAGCRPDPRSGRFVPAAAMASNPRLYIRGADSIARMQSHLHTRTRPDLPRVLLRSSAILSGWLAMPKCERSSGCCVTHLRGGHQ